MKNRKPVSQETKDKIGKANKVSIKKKWEDPIYKEYMTNAHLGQVAWNKGLKGQQIAWNKGLECSEDTKLNMRLARLGKEPANKGKKNPKPKKEHPNWKGGINPINDSIRKSLELREWKKKCLERDDYTCQKYKIKGRILNVHHIQTFSSNPELRCDVDNGITLSKQAHKEFHSIYGVKNINRDQLNIFLNTKLK